jgi:hypothetical protein
METLHQLVCGGSPGHEPHDLQVASRPACSFWFESAEFMLVAPPDVKATRIGRGGVDPGLGHGGRQCQSDLVLRQARRPVAVLSVTSHRSSSRGAPTGSRSELVCDWLRSLAISRLSGHRTIPSVSLLSGLVRRFEAVCGMNNSPICTDRAMPTKWRKPPLLTVAVIGAGISSIQMPPFRWHLAVEVRGVEPRSVEPSAKASPSAVVSELRTQEL